MGIFLGCGWVRMGRFWWRMWVVVIVVVLVGELGVLDVRRVLLGAGFERSERLSSGEFSVGFHESKVHGRPLVRVVVWGEGDVVAGLSRGLVHVLVGAGFVVVPTVGLGLFFVRLDGFRDEPLRVVRVVRG